MASNLATIEVWVTISLMYLVLCLLLSILIRRIGLYLGRSEGAVLPRRRFMP